MPPQRRKHQKAKGSVLIEYAIVLSIFFLLFYAFVQFFFIFWGFNNATFASRAALRYAVVHGSTSASPATSTTIQNVVTPLLWGAPSGGASVVTTWTPNNAPGSSVSIKVAIQYHPHIPFFPDKTFVVGTTANGMILQ